MALINENIDKLDEQISLMHDGFNEVSSTVSEMTSFFNNDTNYQVFVSGTQIGNELNEKLKKIIEIAKNLNENEVQNLIKITTQFSQLQRDLNKGGN